MVKSLLWLPRSFNDLLQICLQNSKWVVLGETGVHRWFWLNEPLDSLYMYIHVDDIGGCCHYKSRKVVTHFLKLRAPVQVSEEYSENLHHCTVQNKCSASTLRSYHVHHAFSPRKEKSCLCKLKPCTCSNVDARKLTKAQVSVRHSAVHIECARQNPTSMDFLQAYAWWRNQIDRRMDECMCRNGSSSSQYRLHRTRLS